MMERGRFLADRTLGSEKLKLQLKDIRYVLNKAIHEVEVLKDMLRKQGSIVSCLLSRVSQQLRMISRIH